MTMMKKIAELKPHPKNDYFFDDIEGEKWEEFTTSIQRNGIITPLVITEDGTIVSGHQRYRACQALGIEEVPCREIPLKNDDDIILAIIESNIRQRGIINSPSIKLGRIMLELERIYGVENRDKGGLAEPGKPTRRTIREHVGIDRHCANRSKALAGLAEPMQDLVESEAISLRTACEVVSRLTPEEQVELAKQLDPIQKYTQSEVKAAINRFFPKAAEIDEMQQKLAEYQQNDGELELREKLREAQTKERQTFEDLQTEKRLRRKERAEHEKHMDAMNKLLDEQNPDMSDEIARLTEERDQYMKDADAAQSNADIDLVISLIGALNGPLTQVANDPRPLAGDAVGTALQLIDQLEERLEQIRDRIAAGDESPKEDCV